MESDHIVGVHDMIIHNYGAGRSIASLHAEVPSDSDFVAVHEEIDEAEKRVWQQTGVYPVSYTHLPWPQQPRIRQSGMRWSGAAG